mmetsp:Transcript_84247/g.195875  ORF Transcript_84247/g.195875 Transcript_84247/m.195875 type:complete len:187 (+) Transcript_84247:53-613(+)|eukprot:CAMPEP_0171145540 /NCGR_PEP_ID=MMETSP0766_2-20121228/147114_1 /TAXON_ID=439317 /ORGANISM="Gambierdiscus australes, Strain CAWD 149" /LENGTH=186 /DNA_ID=CAMNT_0011609445 /DNA_START=47 /DNA_END=607 /DNA_ORIENTATION=+
MNSAAHVLSVPLLALLTLSLLQASAAEEFTGYVVDNYCWDQDNHQGIDNALLGTAPQTHILHCVLVSFCKASGFVVLEKLSSPAQDGSTYWPKYQLDADGDALVIRMAEAEMSRGGDRPFDEQVTVKGTVSDSEMAVTSLCITPKEKNPSQETFCFDASSTDHTVPLQLAGAVVALGLASFFAASL